MVIGAGQAGLSAGYHLAKRGLPFVILDADARIGDHWRDRWDSLKLYSPAKYDSLPGRRFPAPSSHWPTGREMGDYLEAYARWFELPVRSGTRVDRVEPVEDGFVVSTAAGKRIAARQVVVASGPFRQPNIPAFAAELDPSIQQLHSHEYRNPSQLPDGPVLVVGLSHSGADIAIETASAGHRTILSGRSHGQMPIRVTDSKRAMLGWPVVEFVFGHVMTLRTPMGRRMRPEVRKGGGPLLRVRLQDLDRAGVERHDAKTVDATGRQADARRRHGPRRGQRDLGHRLPARLLVRRGADHRRGRLAGRGPRRQPDRARALLPGRPVPVRVLVDARRGRRPGRGVRRRADRGTGRGGVDVARAGSDGRRLTGGVQAGRSRSAGPM